MTVRFDLLGPLARSGAATDGLTHSIKQALELLWEVCNYCDQRFETPEVLCMLLATLLKTAPRLGTNQGLGRPLTLGLMRHVHLVRLNCLVKMLTAILPNAEPIDLLCRLFSKGLQLPAVGATAIQLYRLGPIRGLPGRELAA
jgi:hypothetical protein